MASRRGHIDDEGEFATSHDTTVDSIGFRPAGVHFKRPYVDHLDAFESADSLPPGFSVCVEAGPKLGPTLCSASESHAFFAAQTSSPALPMMPMAAISVKPAHLTTMAPPVLNVASVKRGSSRPGTLNETIQPDFSRPGTSNDRTQPEFSRPGFPKKTDFSRFASARPNTPSRPKLHRLNLRLIDPRIKTSREQIFEVAFGQLNTPLTRLFDSGNGFYAATDDIKFIDQLLTPRAFSEFAKINIQPVLPPEIKAKRTIFVRQVDSSVGGRSSADLKTEISKLNQWAKITEIIKIKEYTHVFKIFCTDVSTASRILSDGFIAFSTKISASQCEPEEFTHILICYKCYQYETHSTKDCKIGYDVCSECAQRGHTYKECPSSEKRCLNCPPDNNSHRTLAAKCPFRKSTIAAKNVKSSNARQNAQHKSYADIAKQVIIESKSESRPTNVVHLTSKTHLKMTALILEAHVASLSGQSYGKILSESLKRNFDIDAKFPDRDSQRIFNFHFDRPMDDMLNDTEMDFDLDDAPPESLRPPKQVKPRSRPRSVSVSDKKRKATAEAAPDLENVWDSVQMANSLGLRLLISEDDPVPLPSELSHKYVSEAISNGKLKFLVNEGSSPKKAFTMIKEGLVACNFNQVCVMKEADFLTFSMGGVASSKSKRSRSDQPVAKHHQSSKVV
jgi:hypothetical protein